MGEGREIRVVLLNCELVCSLCKVSSVILKVMWKSCVLSEGNIWESTKKNSGNCFPLASLSARHRVHVEAVWWWWTGF